MSPNDLGPMKTVITAMAKQIKENPDEKHWFCGGKRSVALAVRLLLNQEVVAIPTDTIYGLAALATETYAIKQLYKIKQRDENKPLAICLSTITDIPEWGVVDNIPNDLLATLLPGPVTVIVKRKATLNPALNPGIDTVGIRVPGNKFIRNVAAITGPLALTSANTSNQPSCLESSEFSELWPDLAAIFYDITPPQGMEEARRKGSTIIDLTEPGFYKIVRSGLKVRYVTNVLHRFGLKMSKPE